jgi:hypothetical protein
MKKLHTVRAGTLPCPLEERPDAIGARRRARVIALQLILGEAVSLMNASLS